MFYMSVIMLFKWGKGEPPWGLKATQVDKTAIGNMIVHLGKEGTLCPEKSLQCQSDYSDISQVHLSVI